MIAASGTETAMADNVFIDSSQMPRRLNSDR